MTVCFEVRANGTLYSVRRAGASLRLYSNGVFHSQWNPNRPFAGGVWDCLSLPALYRDVSRPTRVLCLGVGGGAAILQLRLLLDRPTIIGVDRDPRHIAIARDWFGVRGGDIQLVRDDARRWLERWDGPRFDLVIDDLFGHEVIDVTRSLALDADWVARLAAVTTDDGLLVANNATARELKRVTPVLADAGFDQGILWRVKGYANAVLSCSRRPLTEVDWQRGLESRRLSSAVRRAAILPSRRPLRYGRISPAP